MVAYLALATIAVLEVKLKPADSSILIKLLKILQLLIDISLISFPVWQGIRHRYMQKMRFSQVTETVGQLNEELSIACQIAPELFNNTLLAERLEMQASILTFRTSRLPNWTTATSALLVVPLSILLTLKLIDPEKLKFLSGFTPFSLSVFGVMAFFASMLFVSLWRSDVLAQEQESCIRMAYILRQARRVH